MEWNPLGLFIGLLAGLFSYWLGRRVSRHWRARQDQRRSEQARATETRQQRRARQRREQKAQR